MAESHWLAAFAAKHNATFDAWIPVTFRIHVLCLIGLWGWSLHLFIMRFLYGIQVSRLLIVAPSARRSRSDDSDVASSLILDDLSSPTHENTNRFANDVTQSPRMLRVVADSRRSSTVSTVSSVHSENGLNHCVFLANFYTMATAVCLWWYYSTLDESSEKESSAVPPTALLVFVLIGLFWPGRIFAYSMRATFLRACRRIMFGGWRDPVPFADVLLADVFTSYSKTIGDMELLFCGIALGSSNAQCWSVYMRPFLLSFPSYWRFRQCISEYRRSDGKEWRHAANAIKYATALPVVWLTFAQKSLTDYVGLHIWWVMAVLVNSLYSFWWDVHMDWDLGHFALRHGHIIRPMDFLNWTSTSVIQGVSLVHLIDQPSSLNKPIYPMLRPRLLFRPFFYYFCIAVDLLLRLTWLMRLYYGNGAMSSWLDTDVCVFLLQWLEIGRRWLWLFIRVEHQWWRDIKR